ncbi:MAG: LpxI family protein [Candidatus Omnitrophica bacterium]|nr:LpxI family protein [Candidatus Omnitrophota bacterium]
MKTVGIIAGNGRFPVLSLEEARRQGFRVVVCGIEKEAEVSLEQAADAFEWVKIGQLRKLRNFFLREQTSQVLMAGKIEKVRLFQENVSPDFDMVKMLAKTRDFKDDSLLGAVASYLQEEGIELMDSTIFLRACMPGSGVLGRCKPSRETLEDIDFGFRMAKAVAGLDIGQTVAVKKKAVLAVEAIEGTDLAIRRAAQLGRDHCVVVKVAKPNQDMRFDVPAVGLKTLDELIQAKAAAFAFEAGKTLFMDLDQVIEKADRHKIPFVGYQATEKS